MWTELSQKELELSNEIRTQISFGEGRWGPLSMKRKKKDLGKKKCVTGEKLNIINGHRLRIRV